MATLSLSGPGWSGCGCGRVRPFRAGRPGAGGAVVVPAVL